VSLERAFADGPAFVPYVVAGDPSADATRRYVEALVEGGADAVELGLPFSEPIAEGSTIQGGIARALEAGMTPARFLDLAASLDVDAPLVVMTYYNLIYQYGTPDDGERSVEPFVGAAADAGIEGIVVPDLPVDEADPLRAACDEHGLDLVFIVAPTTTDDRLERIMERVSGYVYVQARLGTTGARADVSDRTAESLARLSGYDVPKAVGFGISEGDHAERVVAAGADGVIVGSAIVDRIAAGVEEDAPVGEVAAGLESFAAELKAGAERGYRRTGREPEAK
jgi:tryptophan synthase alpha chain